MVIRKSEYQNQYKSCVIKKNQAAYLENLNLRHQRRDREFLHTPICWEELNDEEEKVSSDCSDDGPHKPAKTQQSSEPETQYQSLAEILSDSREKADAVRKKKLKGFVTSNDASTQSTQKKQFYYTEVPSKVPEEEETAIETECLNQKLEQKHLAHQSKTINNFVDEENRKLNKKLALTYAIKPEDLRDISEDSDHVIKSADRFLSENSKQATGNKRTKIYRKKRSKEPEGLNKMKPTSQTNSSLLRIQNAASSGRHYLSPKAAGSMAPETFVPPLSYVPRVRRPDRQAHIPRTKSTPGSPEPPLKQKPLFLAYGNGDKEDNLATHRTHNVRSSVDVYPHALKEKIRREEQHKRQKEKIHRARSADVLSDKLSAAFTQDPRDWESEYRKQFHGYEPKDYEKAIASHAVIPRSSHVRAVHRGGCLLVQVD